MKHSWINAEMAVPPHTKVVLCRTGDGGYWVLYYENKVWWDITLTGKVQECPVPVTHWQPLVPPEE